MNPILNDLLAKIAQKHLNIHTLDERKSDNLDFHSCAVWNIKKALEAAFNVGVELGVEMTLKHPNKVPNEKD